MTPWRLNLRVYFEDTDAGGIVYHARYLAFAERGRTEMLRGLGLTHTDLRDHYGLIFVVPRVEVDYQRPARLDDLLTVETMPTQIGAASVRLRQAFMRGETPIAVAAVRLACVRATDGRPARWPPTWVEAFNGQTIDPNQ